MPWAGIALTLVGILAGIIVSVIYAAITDYLHNVHVRLDGIQSAVRNVKDQCTVIQTEIGMHQDVMEDRFDKLEKLVTPIPTPDMTIIPVTTELDSRNV